MVELIKKNKNFRLFWIATSISVIGDYIDDIAFAQLVFYVTKSTLLSSYVFAIKLICSILGVITSTIVDRHSKKNILVTASFLQGINLLFLLVLYDLGHVSTIILLIMVSMQSVFSSFVNPARNAMIIHLVSKKEIINARASMSIINSLIRLSSYALSGFLISFLGIKYAILMDVITFFSSTLLLKKIQIESKKESRNNSNPIFTDIKNGFRFILTNKVLLSVVFVTFLGNMATVPIDGLLPAYIQQNNLNIWGYSGFMIFTSIGGLLGGYIISIIQNKMRYHFILAIGFLLGAIGMIGLSQVYLFAILFSGFITGISISLVSIINSVIIQIQAPDNMQARAFSFFSFISYISSPIGMVMAGALGEKYSMNIVFPLFGSLLFVASIFSILAINIQEKHFSA